MKFRVPKSWYEDDDHIFQKTCVTIEEGITVLVGCNGSGKSTLISIMKQKLEEKKIPYVHYDNMRDGGSTARSTFLLEQAFDMFACAFSSSEGENITMNASKYIGKFAKLCDKSKEDSIFLLLDALDSGLSIDNIQDMKSLLHKLMEEFRSTDKHVYIIISANEYELTVDESCLDVSKLKYVSIKSYDKFKKIVLASRQYKDDRYKRLSEREDE